MKYLSNLDFALDRAARQRHKRSVLGILGLVFGIQIGVAAWRVQEGVGEISAVKAQLHDTDSRNAQKGAAVLAPDQVILAASAQAMIENLSVPWDELFSSIESARTPTVFVDSITPHAQDASVVIIVKSRDFAVLAKFLRNLSEQAFLAEVELVSETLSEGAGGALRAVIRANWRQAS